jgi:hypothetical protein
MPDAAMMIMTYATTAALASAGGAERATRQPALPLAFAAKAWHDFATCLRLGQEEWADNKALCSWCQLATMDQHGDRSIEPARSGARRTDPPSGRG